MTRRYLPEKFNVVTSADETAMLSDIDRITGESLFDYKKRILESSKRLSNSSYDGLINGINRELGLAQRELITVDFKPIVNGDLEDPNTQYNEFIISDNRLYEGIIDGTLTRILDNKLRSHDNLWTDNYLAGLKVCIGSDVFRVISNTYNEITLDRAPTDLHINESFTIRAIYVPNAYIGYALLLDGDKYEILANTDNTFTVNKPITYQQGSTYSIVLNRPRVKVSSSRIVFYKEYLNEENYQVDLIVNLRENSLTHRGLVKLVNEQSHFFNLTDLIPFEQEVKAFTLKQKDSDVKVFDEAVPASKFFKLKNKNVKPGTVNFSESGIFGIEEDELNEEIFGPYYAINHLQGAVKSSMLASGAGQVSYTHMKFPFVIEYAPAAVIGLSDKESEQFLFTQKEKILFDDPRQRFESSQPTAEMIEYISELLRVSRQSWGE
jgi:hypothetical protein